MPRWLNLELVDSSGEPLAERDYELAFDGGAPEAGKLDGSGRLSREAPDGAARATLVVAHRRLVLSLAGLPDAQTVEGVQERLNRLNYFVGNVDGVLGHFTAGALRRFQEAHDLDVTGELNPSTIEALRREAGR